MPIKCLIDNSDWDTLTDLHRHLRLLKTKQADYYQKYYPRKDLLTGEPIVFKDYEQYFATDFLNKNNLKKYCENNPEKGLDWGTTFLRKRVLDKSLARAPHHSELRSLQCPSISFYEKYSDYNKICSDLGLETPFNYKREINFTALRPSRIILQDSREQKPLNMVNSITQALPFGDYALAGEDNLGIYVERKSISDLCSTLSKGLERFHREIERAKLANAYLIVMVECDMNSALSFNYLPQMKFSKVSPSHIFKNMRDILKSWDNVQFLFVDGRKDMGRALIKIFEMGLQVKNTDLEWAYEAGKI